MPTKAHGGGPFTAPDIVFTLGLAETQGEPGTHRVPLVPSQRRVRVYRRNQHCGALRRKGAGGAQTKVHLLPDHLQKLQKQRR